MTNEAASSQSQSEPIRESHTRSILKGISWRIFATIITGIATYIITGQVETAGWVMLIEFPSKVFIYYLHERMWLAVPPGTIRKFNIFFKKKETSS